MSISATPVHERFSRRVSHAYIQFSYLVISRFQSVKLRLPEGQSKGVVLSFDVETWRSKCGGQVESSANPEDEYFQYLPALLDLFKDYSVSAQFFVCGKVLELYPEVFKMLLKRGHSIGGHGYTHEPMYTLSIVEQKSVIRRVRSVVNEVYGASLKSWRCPGLAANRDTYKALNEFGVKLCSNAPWGKPMIIEGVVEIPLVRKMDDQIMKYNGLRGHCNTKRWAEYMIENFKGLDRGMLVFGMHTWVQRECDPEHKALTGFLNYLESHEDEVWIGSLENF